MGELPDSISLPPRLASQLRYAKFGLAGCARHVDWIGRWQRAIANLPAGVAAVAVAYADAAARHAPTVETVLASARAVGCAAVLFDTFGKSDGSLLAHFDLARLSDLISESRRAGLLTVVAGGLKCTISAGSCRYAPTMSACAARPAGEIDPAGLTGRVREQVSRARCRRCCRRDMHIGSVAPSGCQFPGCEAGLGRL